MAKYIKRTKRSLHASSDSRGGGGGGGGTNHKIDYKALTGKNFVFWMGGRLRAEVAHGCPDVLIFDTGLELIQLN